MVYITHGETLLDFITEQNPRNLQRVQVLADIGAAMAFLHSSRPQIVHGDLKDSNIFVEETCHARRRAKLLDFGCEGVLHCITSILNSTIRRIVIVRVASSYLAATHLRYYTNSCLTIVLDIIALWFCRFVAQCAFS